MLPVGEDVAGPDRAVALRAGEEGTREDEGTVSGFATELTFGTGRMVIITVTRSDDGDGDDGDDDGDGDDDCYYCS